MSPRISSKWALTGPRGGVVEAVAGPEKDQNTRPSFRSNGTEAAEVAAPPRTPLLRVDGHSA